MSSTENKEMCNVLGQILGHADTKIQVNGKTVEESMIRETYMGVQWQVVNNDSLSVVVPDEVIESHMGFINDFFKQFVNDKQNTLGVSKLIINSNSQIPNVHEFLKENVIRASVLLGVDRVSNLLCDWKNGEEKFYKTNYLLLGATVESPFIVQKGVRILPFTEENTDGLVGFPVTSGRGVIITVENKIEKVFTNSVQTNVTGEQSASTYDPDFIKAYANCLSLLCDSYFPISSKWSCDKEIQAFSLNSLDTYPTNYEINLPFNQKTLSKSNVIKAWNLVPNYAEMTSEVPRLKVSVDRLVKSNHARAYDQYIEMRIALESLFLEGRASSDRIAIHASKFLSEDLKKRKLQYKAIRNFYGVSSTIIHGNPEVKIDEEEIREIQSICKKAIIKILEDRKIPEWIDLVLGIN